MVDQTQYRILDIFTVQLLLYVAIIFGHGIFSAGYSYGKSTTFHEIHFEIIKNLLPVDSQVELN